MKKLLYWNAFENRLLRDARAVLFTSQREMELAPETFPNGKWRGFNVPQGILAPSGSREIQMESFHAACPEVRGLPFFLFLGRIHKKKGCDLLVRAFGRVAKAYPPIHLVVAGPDEEGWKSSLRTLASQAGVGDLVHFPGMLEGDAKWGAFYASEAFVLPSHQENFGIAVAESLACGTPVLISNQVNIWKDIVEDRVGFVEDDDLEGTVRLLQSWLALSSGERKAMIARCFPSFQRRYDMRRVPQAIAALFSTESAPEALASVS